MLAYQQAYYDLVEQKRHNAQVETENWRHNKMSEQLELRAQNINAQKIKSELKLKAQDLLQQKWINEQSAYVNRLNALTNQAKARNERNQIYYNYVLGQRNADISQFSADTARYNSRTNYQTLLNQQAQTQINQQNANTNWYSAVQSATINQGRLSLDTRLGYDTLAETHFRDVHQAASNYMNAAARLASAGTQVAKLFIGGK